MNDEYLILTHELKNSNISMSVCLSQIAIYICLYVCDHRTTYIKLILVINTSQNRILFDKQSLSEGGKVH